MRTIEMKLIFDTAAHCEVCSSPVIFSMITKILLEILVNQDATLSDDPLEELLKNMEMN